MYTFLVAAQEVPEHRWVLEVGLWVALLRVDECRELDAISDEEDWCVAGVLHVSRCSAVGVNR